MMLGYVARLEPLALRTYRFRLELVAADRGEGQVRTVADKVVDDVDLVDLELVFVGLVVESVRPGAQLRSGS